MKPFLVLLGLVPAALTTTISSPRRTYVLQATVGRGTHGRVYAARCALGDVIIKCGKPERLGYYEEEFRKMELLKDASWSVKPIEFFRDKQDPCIAMELLGMDTYKRRDNSNGHWPIVTISSIGVAMFQALQEMHFKHGMFHRDMHPGNVAVRVNDPRELVILDYGSMQSTDDNSLFKTDARQAAISLRYYWDGDMKFFAGKNYNYSKTEVCAGIPSGLCEVIDFVYTQTSVSVGVYRDVVQMLTELTGGKDGVDWTGVKLEKKELVLPPAYDSPPSGSHSSWNKKVPDVSLGDHDNTTTTKASRLAVSAMLDLVILVTACWFIY